MKVALCCLSLFASISMAGTPLPDGSSLSLSLSRGKVQATVAVAPKPHLVVMDAPLKQALVDATDLFVVGQRGFPRDGHDYLIVAVARPSVPEGGTGYCGAGTEDQLLSVEWQRSRPILRLRDALRVQSCLRTFELASDQGSGMRKVLEGVTDPTDLKLTWLNHPEYGNTPKSITVKNGKFQVE